MSLLGSVIPSAFSQNLYQAFAACFGFMVLLMLGKGPGAVGWYVRVSKEVKVDKTADTRSQGR